MYFCDFVEDDEFWDENCVLCDFATAVTEREKCKEGCSPEKDTTPVEFIIVQARFHYNAATPDEPWHITVDFGNRATWNNGDGFFRRGYHIYAKNNDLSQGYAGYSSPIRRKRLGRIDPMKHSEHLSCSARNSAETGPSTSLDNTEATFWVPWGTREYYRKPELRGLLHKTTHRSLIPPTVLSEARAQRTPEYGRKDKATGAWIWNPIQVELDDMISCIRDGASKPAIPSKGAFMVPGPSGDLVHVRQAVADFRKAGKKIPHGLRVVLGDFHASRRISEKTARGPGEIRARSAFDKTRRTTRTTTRSREGALKSKRLDGTGKSFRPKSKMRDSLDESLGAHQDRPGTERHPANGSSTNKEDGGARLKSRPRVTAGSPKPKKSEATKPGSSRKLTIRDPFDTDAGARQGVSASGELDSQASREKRFGKLPDDGEFEPKGRSRSIMRRPKATTKYFDLGHALLNTAPEPGVPTHHRQGPKEDKPASGDDSARPRTKRLQNSSLGESMLDWDSEVSSGGGRSPRAPGPRNEKPGASGRRESGLDTRKAGKKTGSPLPPADVDLVSESGKKMDGPYKAQRPRQTRAPKTTPAWALPRSEEEATSGEIHA
ncbi:hypothetical protein FJTKL_11198 [Diaporthe vaccinii]